MPKILYPGTFDPMTYGHLDLIRRASKTLGTVIVAIAENKQKKPIFTVEERIYLAQQAIGKDFAVEVCAFDELLVTFARKKQASIILRGLRAVSDFDFEFQLTWMNRRLEPELETVFLMPSEEYAYISSTMVKEIARLGGDVTQFVPPIVKEALQKIFSAENFC